MSRNVRDIERVEAWLEGDTIVINIVYKNGDWHETYFDLEMMGPYSDYLDWDYFKYDN